MTKISVIGAGNVGAEVARRTAEKNLGDVVLVDIVEGVPQGKALDMLQSSPIEKFSSKIGGTNDYSLIKDSDVVVVTAGLARKPGMTREDLVTKNGQIITFVGEQIKKYAPNSIVIVVTNPLDVMAQLMWKVTKFPPKRVVGMAGILDTARFITFISMETNVPAAKIEAMVIGGHGDAMVPLTKYTTVDGKNIHEVLSKEKVDAIIQRTRDGGAEIVKLLKTGSAYYAPSSSAVQMVESIIKNKRQTLPCSVYLTGQYGLNDVYIGVPAVLGREGVEGIMDYSLTPEETHVLHTSANVIKDTLLLCEK
ncbi:MAG: malate dehydrogenase [bacterium]|nr:malate dehydrogenase [bacterium]